MFYQISGKGRPLLLLHGFCEDHRIWLPLAQKLTENYRVIIPDLPGFGKSPATEASLNIWVDQLKAVLEEEEISEKIVIIGHSMGGYTALAFAEKYGESVAGLGLFHSTSKADNDEKKKGRNRNILFVEKHGPAPFVKELVPGLFAENPEPDHLELALNIAGDCSSEGIIAALEAMRDRPDRTSVLEKADFHTLIIAGEKDKLIPAESLAELATVPSMCMFEILKESGHMGLLEETNRSAEIIIKFLSLPGLKR